MWVQCDRRSLATEPGGSLSGCNLPHLLLGARDLVPAATLSIDPLVGLMTRFATSSRGPQDRGDGRRCWSPAQWSLPVSRSRCGSGRARNLRTRWRDERAGGGLSRAGTRRRSMWFRVSLAVLPAFAFIAILWIALAPSGPQATCRRARRCHKDAVTHRVLRDSESTLRFVLREVVGSWLGRSEGIRQHPNTRTPATTWNGAGSTSASDASPPTRPSSVTGSPARCQRRVSPPPTLPRPIP